MTTLTRSSQIAQKIICGGHNVNVVLVSGPASAKIVPAKEEGPAERRTPSAAQSYASRRAESGLFSNGVAVKGINVTSRRLAHTDVAFPDMSKYRRESTLDTQKPARETEEQRKVVMHAVYYGAGGAIALWTGKEIAQTLVYYKAMAADQRALASIEIKMSDIPEGQTKTFEWRGKPVFVKHRTANEIAREKAVNVSELRHPQHDDERVQKDEWSVVIGVCTHLGCVPIAGAGEFGGYYCPCHGSHYDGSGRIRKGPAPLNLNVPAYLLKEDTIVVGTS